MTSVVEFWGQGLNESSRKWKNKNEKKIKIKRFTWFLTLKIDLGNQIEVIFDNSFKSE